MAENIIATWRTPGVFKADAQKVCDELRQIGEEFSPEDIVQALNVSDAAVYLWETGETRPKIDNLIKLANLYGCTIDDLVTCGRKE